MVSTTQSYTGGCHCGSGQFVYSTAMAPENWSIRACQCGFCRAHGAQSASDPNGRLEFLVSGDGALVHYRFGLRTAAFLFCRSCGVYVGAQFETDRGAFGVINIRAMQQAPVGIPAATSVNYEQESVAQRQGRRERLWTPLEKLV